VNLLVWTKVIEFQSKKSNGDVMYALLPEPSAAVNEPPATTERAEEDESLTFSRKLSAMLMARNCTTIRSNELSTILKTSGVKQGRQRSFIDQLVANGTLTALGQPQHGIKTYELSMLRTADNENASIGRDAKTPVCE
jgi:hypothetical protein